MAEATRGPKWAETTPSHNVGPLYLSTDSPALQELTLETFPDSYVTIEGEPVPSWDEGRAQADYAKVVADYEMLKRCDFIAGPVSSRYARTATEESLRSPRYTNSYGFCRWARAAAKSAAAHSAVNQADQRCMPINASGPVRLGVDD